MVIEVDGGYHSERSQQEDDKLRTSDLESMGFAVIRFSNKEIFSSLDAIIEKIKTELKR